MSFKRWIPDDNVRQARSAGQNQPGIHMSKNGDQVQYESQGEHIFCLVLDRDPTVLRYVSQPEKFAFIDEQGKEHSYIPDYKVFRHNGSIEIHEVTLNKRRERDDIVRREKAARKICAACGWKYVVHTETDLPDATERANLLALSCYRARVYARPAVSDAVSAKLTGGKRVLLVKLKSELAQELDMHPAYVMGALGHMLWLGQLQTNMTSLVFHDAAPVRTVLVWLPTVSEA
jgi:hypothetical protein